MRGRFRKISHKSNGEYMQREIARVIVVRREVDVRDEGFGNGRGPAIRGIGKIDEVGLGCAVANEGPVTIVAAGIRDLNVEVTVTARLSGHADVRIRREVDRGCVRAAKANTGIAIGGFIRERGRNVRG